MKMKLLFILLSAGSFLLDHGKTLFVTVSLPVYQRNKERDAVSLGTSSVCFMVGYSTVIYFITFLSFILASCVVLVHGKTWIGFNLSLGQHKKRTTHVTQFHVLPALITLHSK